MHYGSYYYRQNQPQPYNHMNFPFMPQQKMNYPSAQPPQFPLSENANSNPYEYFQKPEQPMTWPNNMPYEPQQAQNQQQMPPNMMSSFQKENGQLDLDKVLTTVGQLASTYHQVAPIVQQFGSFMKNFRAGS
ncbi:YppG family protein [Oceanobacillus senegalensis]|uniref:YppG family protein n=1 Tax=Oceanobacillus senegalensis TaxID=1936063 RepID=UPI0015C41DBC|nr:YppG family protein [Oceanobacillus senegalensis]